MGREARPEIDRFNEKYIVDEATGCWNWAGSLVGRNAKSPAERGVFYLGPGHDRTRVLAYRWSYEHFVGPIPEGLQIDHLCRNPRCVNPEHLEPVTARENVRRGTSHIAQLMDTTHCPRGHELFGDNLYIGLDGGRRCKTCRLDRTREYEERNREKRRAADNARRRAKRAAERAAREATSAASNSVAPAATSASIGWRHER